MIKFDEFFYEKIYFLTNSNTYPYIIQNTFGYSLLKEYYAREIFRKFYYIQIALITYILLYYYIITTSRLLCI